MPVRSPNYPQLSLPEAVQRVGVLWNEDGRNPMTLDAISHNLGYASYNGSAQGVISALKKYGLLEGKGDRLLVSEDAITILEEGSQTDGGRESLRRSAFKPALFSELRQAFPASSPPSENTLRFHLLKKGFNKDAAARVARVYRETMGLVTGLPNEHGQPEEYEDTEDLPGGQPMTSAGVAAQERTLPQLPPSRRLAFEGTEVAPFSSPLLDGNMVEFRVLRRIPPEEVDDLKAVFEFWLKKIVARPTPGENEGDAG